jgi:hypothetical protein
MAEYQRLTQKVSPPVQLRGGEGGKELFVVGKEINDKTQKRALMLHCAGMDVQDIFYTLPDNGNANIRL